MLSRGRRLGEPPANVRHNRSIATDSFAMRLRLLLAALVAFAAAPALHAQSFDLAGRNIHFAMPAGYCATADDQAERPIVDRIRYGIGDKNRLLLVAVHCDELTRIRALKKVGDDDGFDDYLVFSVMKSNDQVMVFAGVDRPTFIRKMRETMHDTGAYGEGLKHAEERLRHLGATDQPLQNLGVIDADANGLYFAVVSTQVTEAGQSKEYVICLGSSTIVKELPMGVALFKRTHDPSAIAPLLARQKIRLAAFVAANP